MRACYTTRKPAGNYLLDHVTLATQNSPLNQQRSVVNMQHTQSLDDLSLLILRRQDSMESVAATRHSTPRQVVWDDYERRHCRLARLSLRAIQPTSQTNISNEPHLDARESMSNGTVKIQMIGLKPKFLQSSIFSFPMRTTWEILKYSLMHGSCQ